MNMIFLLCPFCILTTSACGTRTPKIEVDLVNMANDGLRLIGIDTRERPKLSGLKKMLNEKKVDEAIDVLNNAPDPNQALPALKTLAPYTSQLIAQQDKLVSALALMERTLNIQDEELQMLWWMVSGWSTKWNCRFDDIDIKARPIMLAKEQHV